MYTVGKPQLSDRGNILWPGRSYLYIYGTFAVASRAVRDNPVGPSQNAHKAAVRMRAVIFVISCLAAIAPTVSALVANISIHNVSTADAFVVMDTDAFDLAAASPETCPRDYPHECSCYKGGQPWCTRQGSGSMLADVNGDNDCEAKRHALDIIYTLCTLNPWSNDDRWFSWRNKMVKPGESVYKCWPMDLLLPNDMPYQ